MSDILDPDDIGKSYAENRETWKNNATIDDLMRRVEARKAAGAKPSSASTAPVETTQRRETYGGIPEGAKVLARGAKDVALGAIEAPKQIIGGLIDVPIGVLRFENDLVDWLKENVGDVPIPVPLTGNEEVDKALQEPTQAAQKAFEAIQPGEARSVTGRAIRNISRFVWGLALVGKPIAGAGAALVPAGAVTDFIVTDPDAGRLADLWNDLKLPQNTLTDYLASDPSDSEMEGRFKNAIEGTGLGLLTEGVRRGAALLRAKYIAAKAAGGGAKEIPADIAAPKLEPKDFAALGDMSEEAPLISVKSQAEAKIAKALTVTETGVPEPVTAKGILGSARSGAEIAAKETVGEPALTINFARMDTPENIKQVFRDTAEAFSGHIDEARRGKITLDETARMADRLGMTSEQLIARIKGQAYNAEQIVAAGRVMDSTTEKLFEITEKAASLTASDVDQFMFRKMLAVHAATQAEFLGAIAEGGRTLNAVKIAQRGGSVEMARSIQNIIESMGGADTSKELAKRLLMLKAAGSPESAISQFARKGATATTVDAVKEVWKNGLLSSPTTHIVNTTSNTMVAVQQIYERAVAEKISTLRGALPGEGIAPGEAGAMYHGMKEGLRDSFRSAAKMLAIGESEFGDQFQKVADSPTRYNRGAARAVSARAFNLNETGAFGQTVDLLGELVNMPGKFLGAEDEFFKSNMYRAELHAQAYRMAYSEALQGEEFGKRVAEILMNPPASIKMAAVDQALYATFNNKMGEFGNSVLRLRSSWTPIEFILPFVKTPVNIARYSFERSPLAPFVQQLRADVAAGGTRGDLALARAGTGTAITFLATDLAMSGLITGRGPIESGKREALMREGWTPYSVKVGDKYYSFNRLDPLGLTLGLSADFVYALSFADLPPEEIPQWNEVAAGLIGATAQATVNKTYLQGMSNFFEMMSDPTRYTASEISSLVGSFVPAGVYSAKRLVDPVTRDATDPFQTVMSRIPELSKNLQPKLDLWGEEIKPRSGLGRIYDTFSPVYASEVRNSPIDKEMTRLQADVRRIPRKTSFQGVNVNFRDWPKVYTFYQSYAGNDVKHPAWGLGAKDLLDAVVTGKHPLSDIYRDKSEGRDGGKIEFIKDTVTYYRALAQQEIMNDPKFYEFQNYIKEQQQKNMINKLPLSVAPSLVQ